MPQVFPQEAVKVGAIIYEIQMAEDFAYEGQPAAGMVDYDLGQIKVDRNMAAQAQIQTLWHELFHCLLKQTGHDSDDDEALVEALAYGVMGLLGDNPWLAKLTSQNCR